VSRADSEDMRARSRDQVRSVCGLATNVNPGDQPIHSEDELANPLGGKAGKRGVRRLGSVGQGEDQCESIIYCDGWYSSWSMSTEHRRGSPRPGATSDPFWWNASVLEAEMSGARALV
jgi:hypothetical protein